MFHPRSSPSIKYTFSAFSRGTGRNIFSSKLRLFWGIRDLSSTWPKKRLTAAKYWGLGTRQRKTENSFDTGNPSSAILNRTIILWRFCESFPIHERKLLTSDHTTTKNFIVSQLTAYFVQILKMTEVVNNSLLCHQSKVFSFFILQRLVAFLTVLRYCRLRVY